MIKKANRKALMILTETLCLVAVLAVVPLVNCPPTYDPWYDVNDDGKIDLKDYYGVGMRFGATGTPFDKAYLAYDSGWINITSKNAQCITVLHNLSDMDVIVDITGKTAAVDSGTIQMCLSDVQLNKTYGGTNQDEAYSMIQTSDGGYAIAGSTQSFGTGNGDFWLVKIDMLGIVQWNRTYDSGKSNDCAYSTIQSSDGGYAIAGSAGSIHSNADFWLIKTDPLGNELWNKTYGGVNADWAYSVIQTSDGGYALTGATYSFGAGIDDIWLIKTDSSGNAMWNKTYGGLDYDAAWSVVQTADSGYAMAGYTVSFSVGSCDFWLVKTDAEGNVQWDGKYGGPSQDQAFSMIQTADGGYALAGFTYSYGAGVSDFWLVKTDGFGNEQWNKTYGGPYGESANSVIQTSDGGYAIAGVTGSYGNGQGDFWLVKTDALGNKLWNRTYGGDETDYAYSAIQTSSGGYILVGWTASYGSGNNDFWVVRTETQLGLTWVSSTKDSITLYRNASDLYWNFVRVRLWKPKQNP